MFDDHQADQAHNTDNGASDASSAPPLGLGVNPNPTYVPPPDSAPPTVVLPSPDTASVPEASSSAITTTHPAIISSSGSSPSSTSSGDLEEIKRQALQQLSPLVSQLEQTPEEKYKTIMMMIQASDNQDLINEAYESAQKISDEKTKAEALLNIVNEINYFTQKSQA